MTLLSSVRPFLPQLKKASSIAVPSFLVVALCGFIFSLPGAPSSAPAATKAVPARLAAPASLRHTFQAPTPAASHSFSGDADLARQLNQLEPGSGKADAPIISGLPARKPGLTTEVRNVETGLFSLLGSQRKAGPVRQRVVSVTRGDTLMDILVKKAAVPNQDAFAAVEALRRVYDPRDLKPGRDIHVLSDHGGGFAGLEIARDPVSTVRVERAQDGNFVAGEQKKEVSTQMRGARGQINGSLFEAAAAQGLPADVVMNLIRMYSWSVDFQRDIQPGDSYEVMFEQVTTEDGQLVPGKGEVVYAKLQLSGKDFPLYRFGKGEDSDYYEPDGKSARKALMKTPIDGARLSSGFGMRRHPVLGYSKMHKGIDFAASTGTPIYAAGDGTIEKIGRFSSYGNYVRIRHNNDIKTAYAHMKGFKSGLKSGSRVRQGDVIGYVGTTGRSTGPHLHYEIMMNGAQVNPMKVKVVQGKALKGKELAALKSVVTETNERFAALNVKSADVAAVAAPAPATP